MRHSSVVLLVFIVLVAGCGRGGGSQKPVARLDGQALTLGDVVARMDSSRGMTQAQVAEYARRWINDEILYREAVRRGLDNNEAARARLEEARRQIAISALLQQEVYTDRSLESTPEEIVRYYTEHSKEFTLSGDVVLLSYALFRDRDAANAFRAAVLRGTAWNAALRQMLLDPQQASLVAARIDSMYFNQSTLLPMELWRVASAATKPEPSFPVSTNEGFYILCVWKTRHQGQIADQSYVEKEIRGRLAVERRRRIYAELLEKLRSSHTIEFLVSGEADTSLGR